MKHLVVVRHSTSQQEPGKSSHEWGLTDEGHARLTSLAKQIEKYKLAHIYVGPEPKMELTGQGLAAVLGVPCTTDNHLHETRRDTAPYFEYVEQFREAIKAAMDEPDGLRAEITLKVASTLFGRSGPEAEILSQPRICQKASGQHPTPWWSIDKSTKDPATSQPWDISMPKVQDRVRQLVRDAQPYCVIGSPPCTPFAPVREIGRAKRDPKVMAAELRAVQAHF